MVLLFLKPGISGLYSLSSHCSKSAVFKPTERLVNFALYRDQILAKMAFVRVAPLLDPLLRYTGVLY